VSAPLVADTKVPRLKILQRFPLKVSLSEPAELTLRAGGKTLVRQIAIPGIVPLPNVPRAGIVRIVAWDAAGNASIPVSKR
jgi:hypothetical protein